MLTARLIFKDLIDVLKVKGMPVLHISLDALRGTRARSTHRISAQTFWTLLAVEGLVLTIILAWILAVLVPQASVAPTGDVTRVRAAISDRLTNAVNDPLVEVMPGTSAHESNVRGLSLNGVTYYYYVEGKENFDPFSRGLVPDSRVEKVFRDDGGPAPVVIYTIQAQA